MIEGQQDRRNRMNVGGLWKKSKCRKVGLNTIVGRASLPRLIYASNAFKIGHRTRVAVLVFDRTSKRYWEHLWREHVNRRTRWPGRLEIRVFFFSWPRRRSYSRRYKNIHILPLTFDRWIKIQTCVTRVNPFRRVRVLLSLYSRTKRDASV